MKEYSIKDLSMILGVSVYTIRRRILDRSIVSTIKFGKYVVSENELNKYMKLLENGKEDCIYFTGCGRIKEDYKYEENTLIKDVKFIEEVYRLVDSGRKYDIRSDLSRIFYLLDGEGNNCYE